MRFSLGESAPTKLASWITGGLFRVSRWPALCSVLVRPRWGETGCCSTLVHFARDVNFCNFFTLGRKFVLPLKAKKP